MKEDLTGGVRFRTDRKGRVILQVERNYTVSDSSYTIENRTGWRDAKVEDLPIKWSQLKEESK